MLGPSESALINLGARFPPCMKSVQNLPSSTLMPCTQHVRLTGLYTEYFAFKVSMTRLTHQIFCAPSKKYVALEDSKEVLQTNGFGRQPLWLRKEGL